MASRHPRPGAHAPPRPGTTEPPGCHPPLVGLEGTFIGFIDAAKPNFQDLVDDLGELLLAQYGFKRIVKHRKRGPAMAAAAEVIEELSRECDLVITGSGD